MIFSWWESGCQTWRIHPKTWREGGKVFHHDIQHRNKRSWRSTGNRQRKSEQCVFEEQGNPLCPDASLEKFLSKIPAGATALYLQPRRGVAASDSVWYPSIHLGVNQLSQMLPRTCKEAEHTHLTPITAWEPRPYRTCLMQDLRPVSVQRWDALNTHRPRCEMWFKMSCVALN